MNFHGHLSFVKMTQSTVDCIENLDQINEDSVEANMLLDTYLLGLSQREDNIHSVVA